MIVTSNLAGPGSRPHTPSGHQLLCSVDVEWTKNYRIKNGNRPFCYSAIWLVVRTEQAPVDLGRQEFAYTSVYVEAEEETNQLVAAAGADLATALDHADLIVGHQLCSDLAILANNTERIPQPVIAARRAWRTRNNEARQVLDTRFDTDTILTGRSRRLVDVCEELGLDVSQPELARKSMTALQRDWLANQDHEARERISVLNLRHSFSAALVALRAQGTGHWQAPLNVNSLLDAQLNGAFAWTHHPIFRSLLSQRSRDVIHGCKIVAVEGTHAAGKTTLVHALTAHYRARGVLVTCTGEPARTSPFVEDVVLRGAGEFDVELEVDLFAAQLTAQLRASRHHELLICDKTIMNVAAYSRLVLDLPDASPQRRVCDAMEAFCAAWADTYDAVLFCADQYQQPGDPFRSKVIDLQDDAASSVRDLCENADVTIYELPAGLDVTDRVLAAARHIDPLLQRH